ncbi:trypsin-like serine protease [bacterium]|nr:trypsin-like serine protease [bacterium]
MNYCMMAILAMVCSFACKPQSDYQSKPKIIGGSIVDSDSLIAKHTVKVRSCTGSIVSSKWILTAAHCVVDDNLQVKDDISVEFPGQGMQKFEKVMVHPEYSISSRKDPHDIALIKLTRDIPNGFLPVTLGTGNDIKIGSKVTLAGYGKTEFAIDNQRENILHKKAEIARNLSTPSFEQREFLKMYDLIIIDIENSLKSLEKAVSNFSYEASNNKTTVESIKSAYSMYLVKKGALHSLSDNNSLLFKEEPSVKKETQKLREYFESQFSSKLLQTTSTIYKTPKNLIIYRSANGFNSACNGDSGGPMFVESNGNYKQIGVTHSSNFEDSISIAMCNGSGVYMNVTRYADFIKQSISSN